MDSDKPVDPETERELRDAMNTAVGEMRDEGVAQLASYMHSNYLAFRRTGFGRLHAFVFTVLLFNSLLRHG